MSKTPRHEFYETDEKVTISIFDKGADPEQVTVKFEPRGLTYTHGDVSFALQPLKGQIDPEKSDYKVGKVKVEIRLVKLVQGRWGSLEGDQPDILTPSQAGYTTSEAVTSQRKKQKNWEGITEKILSSDKPVTTEQDPNVGGDSTVNEFFQKLFKDADEDTKRAMMKSYQESGGTTLSTNWDEVSKGHVEVKPPEGSEWKKWGV